MNDTSRFTHDRRQLLGGLVGVLASASLAGCTDRSDSIDDSPDEDAGQSGESGSVDDTGSESEDGADADLDLREANVVDVEFERENGGYAFHVALHHDDEGEDGYANWWQVEALDGTRLGRRELLHAHDQQPFTRSETIEVPDDVTCVVVRGHDQAHEYGGRSMIVNLESGATRTVDQGADPQAVEEGDCP